MQNKPKLVRGALLNNMEIKPIKLPLVILLTNKVVNEMWRKDIYA